MSEILVTLRNELHQSLILPLDYAEARDKVICKDVFCMNTFKLKYKCKHKNFCHDQVLLAARLQSAQRQGFLSTNQVFDSSLLRSLES